MIMLYWISYEAEHGRYWVHFDGRPDLRYFHEDWRMLQIAAEALFPGAVIREPDR
jgi:hypothetical protein